MTATTLREIKQLLINSGISPTDFVEVLDPTMEELVAALEDIIAERHQTIEDTFFPDLGNEEED